MLRTASSPPRRTPPRRTPPRQTPPPRRRGRRRRCCGRWTAGRRPRRWIFGSRKRKRPSGRPRPASTTQCRTGEAQHSGATWRRERHLRRGTRRASRVEDGTRRAGRAVRCFCFPRRPRSVGSSRTRLRASSSRARGRWPTPRTGRTTTTCWRLTVSNKASIATTIRSLIASNGASSARASLGLWKRGPRLRLARGGL
ncbi:hypothetical protein M885DRAFT_530233 [Pelagophyceae sp. CCMP2097]|nr:hypothetical protein M885DRAFT_530233 [Pelagophyceae sp. CCMP2097]